MLAILEDKVYNDPNYLYEIKWDGYRILSFSNHKKTDLHSRKSLNYNKNYPPVVKAVSDLKKNLILDGEVVVLNSKGLPDFDALQRYNGNDPIAYYIFDILWLDGYSLMGLPFEERRAILQKTVKPNDIVRISETFEDGVALFDKVRALGLEGIVAKRKDSLYKPGDRSKDWLKMKLDIRQEYVIGGWTESERGREFASLLFGYYQGKDFYYLGHSGGGFKDTEMPVIKRKLLKLETSKKPFVNDVVTDSAIHWVKPKLVANIKFDTYTRSGKVRKPAIFQGFRDDKKPMEVQYEAPVVVHTIKREKFHLDSPSASNWKKVEAAGEGAQTFNVGSCDIEVSNIEREIWKGYTKAELITYYHSVAKYLLPHLQDRPLSLHVKPLNAYAPGFYIKDMEGHEPECGEIFSVKRKHKEKGKRDVIDYLVCNDEATLLYTINLGCIDVNPWTSRITSPDEPDFLAIDLDPTELKGAKFNYSKVIDVAIAAKEYFDKKKLKAFCKTSGKSGIHFYVPCQGFNFRQARAITEHICEEIQTTIPKLSTTEVSIVRRDDKVYLDPNQNDYADTLAAPYCPRPWEHKTVSTPLEWKEINTKLDPLAFTIETIGKRLKSKGDLFKDVLSRGIAFKNMKLLTKW